MARRAGELPHGHWLWIVACGGASCVQEVLAGRCAHDRERDRAFSLCVLASVFAGGGISVAENDCCSRLAAIRREQDVEVARQYRADGNDSRRAGRGRTSIFPAA